MLIFLGKWPGDVYHPLFWSVSSPLGNFPALEFLYLPVLAFIGLLGSRNANKQNAVFHGGICRGKAATLTRAVPNFLLLALAQELVMWEKSCHCLRPLRSFLELLVVGMLAVVKLGL